MHELSVCQALVRQLRDIAREQRAARITRVVVQIGPLSGVEPELLRHAYPVASAGSPAADAALILEPLPIRIHRTRLISGDELLLVSVELEAEPASAATH